MSLLPIDIFGYLQTGIADFCNTKSSSRTSESIGEISSYLQTWYSYLFQSVQGLVCRLPNSSKYPTKANNNIIDQLLNTYSTTSYTTVAVAILSCLFLAFRYLMNGRSSFSHGGRGSPYTSHLAETAGRNLSGHFEYIGEDHDIFQKSHRPSVAVSDYDNYEHPNDPDIIHVRHMASILPIEFPAFSISEETASVRSLRNQVADHLRTDPRRIRLVYKGRDVRHNSWPLRKYHMKQNSEVAVIVTENYIDYNSGHDSHSSSGDEREPAVSSANERRQRPRAHSSVRHRSDDAIPLQTNGGFLNPNGYVASPTADRNHRPSLHPEDRSSRDPRSDRPHSRASSPAPPASSASAADPNSPMGRIQGLASTFHTRWLPDCTRFILSPPSDPQVREKEYRKLSESVMMQVVLKADTIDTEGIPDARKFRKTLVDEANEVMRKLDAVMGVKKS